MATQPRDAGLSDQVPNDDVLGAAQLVAVVVAMVVAGGAGGMMILFLKIRYYAIPGPSWIPYTRKRLRNPSIINKRYLPLVAISNLFQSLAVMIT